ncbi:unnamed protein product [Merluccius merluccius]
MSLISIRGHMQPREGCEARSHLLYLRLPGGVRSVEMSLISIRGHMQPREGCEARSHLLYLRLPGGVRSV